MAGEPAGGEELITEIKNAAGIILAVTENRNWLEVFFEAISCTPGDIYVEEIPHKTTIYEHPRMMIFFTGPTDLRVTRDGARVIATGCAGGDLV